MCVLRTGGLRWRPPGLHTCAARDTARTVGLQVSPVLPQGEAGDRCEWRFLHDFQCILIFVSVSSQRTGRALDCLWENPEAGAVAHSPRARDALSRNSPAGTVCPGIHYDSKGGEYFMGCRSICVFMCAQCSCTRRPLFCRPWVGGQWTTLSGPRGRGWRLDRSGILRS